MLDRTMEIVKDEFGVTELDAGAYARQKVKGMTFRIRHFEIEGIGHLSTMAADGMFGLMRMDTVILVPLLRDAPLFSYDRIMAIGNDTFILEFYNTMLDESAESFRGYMARLEAEKEKIADIAAHDLGKHWYDPIKLAASDSKRAKKCGGRLDEQYMNTLNIYMEMLKAAPAVDLKAKTAKSREYVEGLFTNGGPSTDAFVKSIGEEKARDMFETVVFGVR